MEELLGRQAPHSASAEQAVIGSMLIDTRCIPDVIERLKGAEFYIQQNRDIFETIYAMFSYGQTIDPITVLDQMKTRGVFRETSTAYIAELMRITPTAANVLEYAAIVSDRALLRNLATAADEINTLVYEGTGEAENMLEAAERKIYALRQGRVVGGLVPISTVVQTVYSNLSEAASSGQKIPGLSTGLNDLDRFILGLNKGELILIAARPGMGKTSIALNIAMNVAKKSDRNIQFLCHYLEHTAHVADDLLAVLACVLAAVASGRLHELEVVIEQDADVVIGLYREGYYNAECEEPNVSEAIVLKNRKGQTGTVKLAWLAEYTTFAAYEGNLNEDDY